MLNACLITAPMSSVARKRPPISRPSPLMVHRAISFVVFIPSAPPAMSEATPPPVSPSVSIARYPPDEAAQSLERASQWCRAAIALLSSFQVRDPPVPRGLLRSWRYGSSADRQVALGSAHVQNAQRGDRGRTWGRVHVNGERVKPSKAVRTGDTIEVTIKTFRHTLVVTGIAERRARRAMHSRSMRRPRVAHRPRTARCRTSAFPSARSRPRHTPHQAGAAPPRRTAPRTRGHTLSVASRALDPAAECDSFLAVGVDASRHPVYEEDEMRKPILSVMLVAVSLTLELAHVATAPTSRVTPPQP